MSRGNASRTIFTFILGVSVGAVTALLLAPKAGEELRGDIVAAGSKEISRVGDAGKKVKRKAQEIAALTQDKVQDAVEAGQEAYREATKA